MGEPQTPDKARTPGGVGKQQVYDWSEVAYLFDDGIIPDELINITDPIEYNYLIVRLKKEFNEKHRSDYLKYMHLDLPYHSRRDELGGVINDMNGMPSQKDQKMSLIKLRRRERE